MINVKILPNVEGGFDDLKDKRDKVLHLSEPRLTIGRLPRGMESGRSSVVLRIDLPNGTVIIAETTMRIFQSAAKIFIECEKKDGLYEE